jgi:hypothetical protein
MFVCFVMFTVVVIVVATTTTKTAVITTKQSSSGPVFMAVVYNMTIVVFNRCFLVVHFSVVSQVSYDLVFNGIVFGYNISNVLVVVVVRVAGVGYSCV